MEKDNRMEIALPNGYKLVAAQGTDPNYSREMFVGIEAPDGTWLQDLAIIRNAYHYEKGKVIWNDGQFNVFVSGDENGEGFTEEFLIRQKPEEDREGEVQQ